MKALDKRGKSNGKNVVSSAARSKNHVLYVVSDANLPRKNLVATSRMGISEHTQQDLRAPPQMHTRTAKGIKREQRH